MVNRLFASRIVVPRVRKGTTMGSNGRQRRDSDDVRTNELLRMLVEGTSSAVGRDFFPSLTTHLAAALGVRCAFAAELVKGDRMRLLAISVGGEAKPPFEYPVAGTPCAIALERGRYAVRSALSKRYPRCDDILGTAAESYIGVRLHTAAGEPLGVLGVLDNRPLKADGTAAAIIGIFAARASAEIQRLRAEEARERSEQRLRAVISNAPLLLTAIDRDGVFRLVDGTLVRRVGIRARKVTGTAFREALKARPESIRNVERALQGETVTAVEQYRGRFLETRYVPVRDAEGAVAGVIGVALDVTEREAAYRSLRASEERLRAVVANAPIVLFAVNRDGVFTLSEGKGLEALGLRPGEVVGRSAFALYEDSPEIVANLRRALAGEAVTGTVAVGDLFFETHYLPVRGDTGEVEEVIGVATDVTERMRAIEQLREQARRDPLTGTLNHAAITETLRELVDATGVGERLAVLVADIDGMKAANDTYGHHIGDAILRTVAGALCEERAIVGRYGGDEFIVILPGAGRAEAERYRDGIGARLRRARVTDGESGAVLPVTVAAGIAVYPDEAETPEDLVRLADSAMYAAKRQRTVGRGTPAARWPLAADRAAKVVGEIVPLLTSPGKLEDKLRLVSHRLSVGVGYDAVNFALVSRPGTPVVAANTFARAHEDLVDAWNSTQRENHQLHPVRELLERARRPIVFDDPWNDERIIPEQRALLKAANLKSAIAVPMLWENQLVGILAVASKRERAFGPRDAQFLLAVATQVTAIVRMATLVEQLQSTSARLEQSQADTVLMLAAAAEARDQVTGQHLQNIRALTEALALELGYTELDARTLGLAAVLHDIGKIRVPDAVLSGSGPLTDEDWELMKQHTVWGAELLAGHPGFELATQVARAHHERWDGTGYPDGLTGDEIPEAAAIVSVADAFDAMISDRPYRAALTVDEAIREIRACAGRQFSPRVAEAMLRLHRRRALPSLHVRARAA
jgi:diguanylate cyclase (GGDEF)-like protein/PAS domain S-box-containing protein